MEDILADCIIDLMASGASLRVATATAYHELGLDMVHHG